MKNSFFTPVAYARGTFLFLTVLLLRLATAQTLSVTDDAYVRFTSQFGNQQNNNYGSTSVIEVKTANSAPQFDRHAYFKFDISSVSGTITSATFRVYGSSQASNSFSVFGIADADDSWTEGNITGVNAPSESGSALSATSIGTSAGWYEWDVTSYVQGQANNTVSILLKDPVQGNQLATLDSKEGGSAAELVITTSGSNNDPTISTISNVTVDEDAGAQSVTLTGISDGDGGQDVIVAAVQTSGSAVTNLSVGSVNSSGEATLNYTPVDVSSNSTSTITVTVTDNVNPNPTATETFAVTVNDVTPTNNAPTISAISNITVNEDVGAQTVTLTGITDGDGGQNVTVTAVQTSGSAVTSISVGSVNSSGEAILNYTPVDVSSNSTSTITVTVTDNVSPNPTANQTFTVTVNDVAVNLVNLALNQSAVASSEPEAPNNVASGAVDDNVSTRWSANGYPQWLEVDLGDVKSISGTELICFQDRAYQFIIETKTSSGGSYSTLIDETSNTTAGTTTSPITNTFSPTDARFVRITVSDAAVYAGNWISLLEFRVFGTDSGTGTNDPPTLNAISNETVNEDAGAQTVTLTGITDGDGGQNVTVTAVQTSGSAVTSLSVGSVNGSGEAILNYTPVDVSSNSTSTITVTVTDNVSPNPIATETFTITVNDITPTNNPPTIDAVVDQAMLTSDPTKVVSLSGLSDGDGGTQTVTVIAAVLSGSSFITTPNVSYTSGSASGSISFDAVSAGTATVEVTVSDDGNPSQSISDQFDVVVSDPGGTGPLQITNLTALTGANYVLANDLQVGDDVWIDRTYTYSSVDASVQGEQFIQTAKADQSSSLDPMITFDVNKSVDVYVAAYLGPMSWLSSWTSTGNSLVTSNNKTMNLYQKTFSAGTVSLGGNAGSGTWTYTVVIKENTSSPPNNAPTISAISDVTVNEDAGAQTLTLTGITDGDGGQSVTVAAVQSAGSAITNLSVGSVNSSGEATLNYTPVDVSGNSTSNITVTVTDNVSPNPTVNETFTITVNDVSPPVLVTSVALDDETITINENQSLTLDYTVNPIDATNQNVIWSSLNSSIVSVNSSGVITGEGQGTADVIVTTVDGGYMDTVAVTVNEAVGGGLVRTNLRASSMTSTEGYDFDNFIPSTSQTGIYNKNPHNMFNGSGSNAFAIPGGGEMVLDLSWPQTIGTVRQYLSEVLIQWKNTASFLLEYSVDGSNWFTIASGNGGNTSNYTSYLTSSNPEINYLRVTSTGSGDLEINEMRFDGFGEGTNSFSHPGYMVDLNLLDVANSKVANNEEPYKSMWDLYLHHYSKPLSYSANPTSTIYTACCGNGDGNWGRYRDDALTAYMMALQWYESGNSAYAEKVMEIMDDWSTTLTLWHGPQAPLNISWSHGFMIRAAELTRASYPNWDVNVEQRFKDMVIDVLQAELEDHPKTQEIVGPVVPLDEKDEANWNCSFAHLVMMNAIFRDDWYAFNRAVGYYTKLHERYFNYSYGQTRETARDFNHAFFGSGALVSIAETAWMQGVDLYSHQSNRIVTVYEWHADAMNRWTPSLNVPNSNGDNNGTAPATHTNPDAQNVVGPPYNWNYLRRLHLGNREGNFAIVHNHFVGRMGIQMPHLETLINDDINDYLLSTNSNRGPTGNPTDDEMGLNYSAGGDVFSHWLLDGGSGSRVATETVLGAENGNLAPRIFPNPVTDDLLIQNMLPGDLVEIFDLKGRQHFRETVRHHDQQILDVSGLSSGLYVIKVHTSDGSFERKLIKE